MMRQFPSPLLTVEGLTVDLPGQRGPTRILEDVSFRIQSGEIFGLVGESGSGKSMTALSLLRLLDQFGGKIVSGKVTFDGANLEAMSERELDEVRGSRMSMIFQEPMACLDPLYTIGSQISEIARRHLGLSKKAAHARAIEMLERVAIPDPVRRADEYPHQLSGGMRQRAMIAMALTCNPKLLIADEPTTALDVSVQAEILDLLRTLRSELDLSVLFITHDLGIVAELCDRVAVMYAGQLVEVGEVAELLDGPRHPYSAGLIGAMPHFVRRAGPMSYIPGQVPPPQHMPVGCRFQPRCNFGNDRDCVRPQALLATNKDRLVRCVRNADLMLRGAHG